MNLPKPEILVRPCQGFDEFDACVRLQTEIWGYDVSDTIPLREFIVIERIGGQVFGAFDLGISKAAIGDSRSMIGFAMAMPGVRDGEAFLHSHMLAVSPDYRNTGIGRRLKLAQREEALARGIQKMEWTFDPLEIKNAYLNSARLGVVVRSYSANFYGVFSSRLQAGLPTDRLHAEWWMNSNRVIETLAGGLLALPEIEATIVVPGAVREWKESPSDFGRAAAAQNEVRQQFLDAFSRGLVVVGFSTSVLANEAGHQDQPNGVYQLARWNEPLTRYGRVETGDVYEVLR